MVCYYPFPNPGKARNLLEIAPYSTWPSAKLGETWLSQASGPRQALTASQASRPLVCVPSETPGLHMEHTAPCTFICTPKIGLQPPNPPNSAPNAYLQSGLLAPYAISTQDTAKQALKGNQNHECPPAGLTCNKLHIPLPPQHLVKPALYNLCKEAGDLETKIQGNTRKITEKPCTRAEAATFPPTALAQLLPNPDAPLLFQHGACPVIPSR